MSSPIHRLVRDVKFVTHSVRSCTAADRFTSITAVLGSTWPSAAVAVIISQDAEEADYRASPRSEPRPPADIPSHRAQMSFPVDLPRQVPHLEARYGPCTGRCKGRSCGHRAAIQQEGPTAVSRRSGL
jgi:hypothetical protein